MNQKWKSAISYLDETINLPTANDIASLEVSQKISRLLDLKDNVDKDENELKLQYLVLMRERNEYFRKLKLIQQVCEQSPNTALVSNIQVLFDSLSASKQQ